jgi:hypothetical protein
MGIPYFPSKQMGLIHPTSHPLSKKKSYIIIYETLEKKYSHQESILIPHRFRSGPQDAAQRLSPISIG